MERRFVYMDYNATTPLREEVRRSMIDDMSLYANGSSMHEAGRKVRERIEEARGRVAELVGASPAESVVFTSGGSESNNTVFAAMGELARGAVRRRIITTGIEHPCVLNAAAHLAELGYPVVHLGVDPHGRVDTGRLEAELDDTVLLVSVMAANNEIGTIQDMRHISTLAKRVGAFVHTDAVQAAGKIPVDVDRWGVDYLTLSAHKIYGPKGVGALYVRPGLPIAPLVRGGHQENGIRAGTYNNLGILGFGIAAELARTDLPAFGKTARALRTKLRDGLLARIPGIHVNGHPHEVLPNTLNVSFPGAEGEAILLSLDLEGIEVSTGSACASGSLEPSHVLVATGIGPELAHGSIRFSLGKYTTEEEIEYVLDRLPPIIARLRRFSTLTPPVPKVSA